MLEPTTIGLCVGVITFWFVWCLGENQNKNQGSRRLCGSETERVSLNWEGGLLQVSRRSALDGSGVSRDSLELEDKGEGASLDWRNPNILWLGREGHAFSGACRGENKGSEKTWVSVMAAKAYFRREGRRWSQL